MFDLPHLRLPPAPTFGFARPGERRLVPAGKWADVPPLPSFRLADDSGPALQQTVARACCDAAGLYVRFDCDDGDIWATLAQRDDPIYNEEVVEVFIAPGARDPIRYFEFEVSPAGVLFDGRIDNPTSSRADLVVDERWNCPGILWAAERDDSAHRWAAVLAIPWAGITPEGTPASDLRANFCRIERPRGSAPEFSCWSPTRTEPADFHKPARFGLLHRPF